MALTQVGAQSNAPLGATTMGSDRRMDLGGAIGLSLRIRSWNHSRSAALPSLLGSAIWRGHGGIKAMASEGAMDDDSRLGPLFRVRWRLTIPTAFPCSGDHLAHPPPQRPIRSLFQWPWLGRRAYSAVRGNRI